MRQDNSFELYRDFSECGIYWKSYDASEVTVELPTHCIFCNAKLDIDGEPDWILYCSNIIECGWWLHIPPPKPAGFKTIDAKAKWAIRKKFNIGDNDIPLQELAFYLAHHPNSMVHTDSSAFEKLVCSLMNEHFGPTEFVHVGKPKDGGKDLIGILSNKITTFVEIKRREKTYVAESVRTVRGLLGVMAREGVKQGVVVSTAENFSKEAHVFSVPKEESISSYEIDLVSFKDIAHWLGSSTSSERPPWDGLIQPRQCEDEWERDHIYVRWVTWSKI
ncbi:MAG: restriction endonuclease [Sulfuritalea sp.]|nr:restriction endonuclease [Sulfuritalea sp.]MDP1984956.1 restriction endonuclease [Sulfuritalea sp.]